MSRSISLVRVLARKKRLLRSRQHQPNRGTPISGIFLVQADIGIEADIAGMFEFVLARLGAPRLPRQQCRLPRENPQRKRSMSKPIAALSTSI